MKPLLPGALTIVFRKFDRETQPGDGEVLLTGQVFRSDRPRQLALDVLADPKAALLTGPGPLHSIVLDFGNNGPNFDDMLATTLVRRWLRGAPTLPGLEAFARYSARQRSGWPVSRVPVEDSLEGLFLESRKVWDPQLPPVGFEAKHKRFLASWRQVEAAVIEAAGRGIDPGHYTFDRQTFRAEWEFLQSDHKRYAEDVQNGERWWVHFPGRKEAVAGLFLRQPRSSLFKQWADQDPQCGSPSDYGFMAVMFAPGNWVFCSARDRRQPLHFLAERLQAAEEQNESAQPDNPWFRGEPFDCSLVASPMGGSRLDEAIVVEVVKDVLGVRLWEPPAGNGSFASKSLLAGWPLPEFRNPEPLSEGGQQAPIFRAETGSRRVALKVCGLENSQEAQARNRRETEIHAHIRRRLQASFDPRGQYLAVAERIVPVHWSGCALQVLVSAFHPEGSLRDWRLKRDTLQLEQLQRFVRCVVQGLELLHSWGLVHHDVKPQNILVSRSRGRFSAVLSDFGCTLEHGQNTGFRDPVFAPPLHEKTAAADLVSLAYVVAWLIAPTDQPLNFRGGCEVRAEVLAPAQKGAWILGAGDRWYDATTDLLLEATQSDPERRPQLGSFLERFVTLPQH